jgi:hypothetical protein
MICDLEGAAIGDRLERIDQEHLTEMQRAKIDEDYAHLLDDVEADIIDREDPRFLEAKNLYSRIIDASAMSQTDEQYRNNFMEGTTNFLTNMYDHEVALLAGQCKGSLTISILGHTAIFCRSIMGHSALALKPCPPRISAEDRFRY